MKSTKASATAVLATAIIGFSSFGNTAMAADYPPSIKTLVVGQALNPPVATKDAASTAIVPKATDTMIPIVVGDPVSVRKVSLATKTLSNSSVESNPVKLTSSLTLGGIGADEKAPTATIGRGSKSEVQIPTDVPTRIIISGFTSASRGSVTFVDSTGKSISLGKINTSSSGRVTIPALTFSKTNVSYTIKVLINGKTTSFVIRSTN